MFLRSFTWMLADPKLSSAVVISPLSKLLRDIPILPVEAFKIMFPSLVEKSKSSKVIESDRFRSSHFKAGSSKRFETVYVLFGNNWQIYFQRSSMI